MNKKYCDLCGKEIKDMNFVQQTMLVNYNFNESVDADICKKCWEEEESKRIKI